MNAADCGAGILVCCCGYSAGVKNYKLSFFCGVGWSHALCRKLALKRCAICLCGAAAKVLYKIFPHVGIIIGCKRLKLFQVLTTNRVAKASY